MQVRVIILIEMQPQSIKIYKQINAVSADMDTVLEGWQTSVRDVNKQPGIWNACASHLMAKLFKKRKNQTFSCS